MRLPPYHLTLATLLAVAGAYGCGGGRLSSAEARKQITEISSAKLLPEAIEIRRVITQGDREAIAEGTATLAFQFKRSNREAPWRLSTIRLGDGDWVEVDELIAAINDGRRRATLVSMEKLKQGVEAYRQSNGKLPDAPDIVKLTDELFPHYMDQLIREDAWGNPLRYEVSGNTYRLISSGPDGAPGNADDVAAGAD
ncbi:MAG TPA: type II secretion system protein GspG [Terriglobia bacterium]|nr:type II secretion system protein GspG [Terriglobia bacterium]